MNYRQASKVFIIALCLTTAFGCKSKTGDCGNGREEIRPSFGRGKWFYHNQSDYNKEVEALPPYLKPMAETPEGKKELLRYNGGPGTDTPAGEEGRN